MKEPYLRLGIVQDNFDFCRHFMASRQIFQLDRILDYKAIICTGRICFDQTTTQSKSRNGHYNWAWHSGVFSHAENEQSLWKDWDKRLKATIGRTRSWNPRALVDREKGRIVVVCKCKNCLRYWQLRRELWKWRGVNSCQWLFMRIELQHVLNLWRENWCSLLNGTPPTLTTLHYLTTEKIECTFANFKS